jgi:hypothetical protein
VRAGEIAARAALPEIRKWLQTEIQREPARVTRPATVSAD